MACWPAWDSCQGNPFPSPSPTLKENTEEQQEGAELGEGKARRDRCKQSRGKQKQDPSGKKQGSRLLYNSWLIRDAQPGPLRFRGNSSTPAPAPTVIHFPGHGEAVMRVREGGRVPNPVGVCLSILGPILCVSCSFSSCVHSKPDSTSLSQTGQDIMFMKAVCIQCLPHVLGEGAGTQ